jgi:glycosyltransferase involved in cell wall biosynthesis
MPIKNSAHTPVPEILLISSYPPRECGIATFSQDLLKALYNKFYPSFALSVCALEAAQEKHHYPAEVRYVLNTSDPCDYNRLTAAINQNDQIKLVLLQHEFGFFEAMSEHDFLHFLQGINKPLIIAFHTILPQPDEILKTKVARMAATCQAVVVMTKNAANILIQAYDVPPDKVQIIAHGVHLVPHLGKTALKQKYGLSGRKVLSTFGLISSGKSIETTLDALPGIVDDHPTVLFLVIGKTHPSVVRHEGEQYRRMLEAKVAALSLENHVKFINAYLPLQELLEYLQLTDIYLFTSKDPNQAVSGTFSYAVSCACAIISTPIPHARELLRDDAGILIGFQNPPQLAAAVNRLLSDKPLRKSLINNGLQRVIFNAWENTAVEYAMLFKHLTHGDVVLQYALPDIHLGHFKKMTTAFGMIQFSKINHPDLSSGYTLDDNARALVAMCMHYERSGDRKDLASIKIYLDFITYCLRPDGSFLNYADTDKAFTKQNQEVNLDDANGRALWALGYLVSMHNVLPDHLVQQADVTFRSALHHIEKIHSTRAMAFVIKGLYYYISAVPSPQGQLLLETLADRLVQMYRHEAESGWHWFENCLTYGNSTMPEAMLCAWLATGNPIYKTIARQSFDFLLQHTIDKTGIKVIPNSGWMQKGGKKALYGEQPIDVAYTILALQQFYEVFKEEHYADKMKIAFNWFLGQNHLNQIIYNPCTGGCYDGLEETQVNLNQGAESTVSYLMARLAVEKTFYPSPSLDFDTILKQPTENQPHSSAQFAL